MFFFSCEQEDNVVETECLLYGSWELFYFIDSAQDDCKICPSVSIEDVPCSEKNTSIIQIEYGGCPSMTFNPDGTGVDSDGNSVTWSGGCSVNDTIQIDDEFALIIDISETMVSFLPIDGDGTYVFIK